MLQNITITTLNVVSNVEDIILTKKLENCTKENILKRELKEKGLELDSDETCSNYVQTANGSIYIIIENLCRKKFLNEYYDLSNRIERMKENYPLSIEKATEMVDLEVFKEGYPDVWPWLASRANGAQESFALLRATVLHQVQASCLTPCFVWIET